MSEVKSYIVVDGQTLDTADFKLPDRKFRDAWITDGTGDLIITIDVEKAKEVWRRRMREARAPLMTKLDAEYFRAMEEGDKTKQKEIATTKKLLRDVTSLKELADAKTVEEIEAVWPDYLKG